MSSIRILSDRVANQIAAGEVIERPVAVVKELVENSIDAGATRIEVEFRNGGKSYIRIEDNGKGMSPDEALLCLERHATSKIREASDLQSIESFGFRGEALPSIASVSRFTLRTRTEGWEHGTEIQINGGKLLEKKDCGMPVGTVIEVAHLFNSVPARRKFLKTEATESAHIAYTTRLFAVAHPQIAFSLLENGRTLFRSPPCENLRERIAEIWGKRLAEDLIPVEAEDPKTGLALSGLTAKPGVGRSTRRELVTLVNDRPVDSRTLGFAVLDAYHGRIQKGRYPPAYLFLRIDPSQVDVNVHPAKREVRFRDEGAVRRFVLESVETALASASIIETDTEEQLGVEPSSRDSQPLPIPAMLPSSRPRLPRPLPAATPPVRTDPALKTDSPKDPSVRPEKETMPPPEEPSGKSAARTGWRLIQQIRERYALFETANGLVMLHLRHAAQRIRYEQIEANYDSASAASQTLLIPIPIELEPVAAQLLTAQAPLLRRNGFKIEPFGRHIYRIEAVPNWLPDGKAENFIRDFLDRAGQRDGRLSQEALCREAVAQLACQDSYRNNELLGEAAIQQLATRLLACETPHTAPSGRPTFTEISWSEWSKKFQE
ncbi:MAG: DNA mismatch repair endonuclease MutL [Coraliomargaritaceae bacterium]